MTSQRGPWRGLSPAERAVLERFLVLDFAGQAEIRKQLATAQVCQIDEHGSLRIDANGPLAPVKERVPVTGRFFDSDDTSGPAVNLLLHVVAGKLSELEVYKDDGSPILVSPFEIDPFSIKFE